MSKQDVEDLDVDKLFKDDEITKKMTSVVCGLMFDVISRL
jgi:hypothetical protein